MLVRAGLPRGWYAAVTRRQPLPDVSLSDQRATEADGRPAPVVCTFPLGTFISAVKAKRVEDTMREDMQQKQPEGPLSTATLAHADHPATAEKRAQDRVDERRTDPALRERERPADGGPTLVPQASRVGRPVQEQNRATDAGRTGAR